MTQPCMNFKMCGGLAHSRKAKICGKCWKLYLETIRSKIPLKNVKLVGKNLEFTFDGGENG